MKDVWIPHNLLNITASVKGPDSEKFGYIVGEFSEFGNPMFNYLCPHCDKTGNLNNNYIPIHSLFPNLTLQVIWVMSA